MFQTKPKLPKSRPGRTPETSLYAAVKAHLEQLGYEAKGEVCGCDIVAVRPGEPPFLVITATPAHTGSAACSALACWPWIRRGGWSRSWRSRAPTGHGRTRSAARS